MDSPPQRLRGLRYAQALSTARVVSRKVKSPSAAAVSPTKRPLILRSLWHSFAGNSENDANGINVDERLSDAPPLLLQQIQNVLQKTLRDRRGTAAAAGAVATAALHQGLASVRAARRAKRLPDHGEKKKKKAADAMSWSCDVCTYLNAEASSVCEVCSAPGPGWRSTSSAACGSDDISRRALGRPLFASAAFAMS